MAIIFLMIAVILCLFLLAHKNTLREALVKTYLVFFMLVFSCTEIASLFCAVNYLTICIFWLCTCFILLTISWHTKISPKTSISHTLQTIQSCPCFEKWMLRMVLMILTLTFLIALIAPPNTWDSMTYHLARVAHWIQNEHVNFYPTSIDRQYYQMPLAEFGILHLQILAQSDCFANLIQWTSFLTCIILASLIAHQWRASHKTQLLAMIVSATTPMAILQASSTQNDLVAGALCCSFAYFLYKFSQTSSWENSLWCTMSFGLALTCKGTTYLFCCGIGLSLSLYIILKTNSLKEKIRRVSLLACICLLGLCFTLPHTYRSYQLTNTFFSNKNTNYFNQEISLATLTSNTIRNSALHLISPWQRANGKIQRTIESMLQAATVDPHTTWPNANFQLYFSLHEDLAGNFLQFLLILATFILVMIGRIQPKWEILVHTIAILIGAILFCLLLRWQPWATRLHTPLFILAGPIVALMIEKKHTYIHSNHLCSCTLFSQYTFSC